MKVALLVGHSRYINGVQDGGAIAWNGISEHAFNFTLVNHVADKLESMGIDHMILSEYQGQGYGAAMGWMAQQVDNAGCNIGIEFHFNDAGPSARGHEVLYCAGSTRGAKLAGFLNSRLAATFDTQDRGITPIDSSGRGWAALSMPKAVMAIMEPFFGSNQQDWEAVADHLDDLAQAVAEAIKIFAHEG
jgi:N-acetylmuramoyl-L-alanine amidase